MEASDEFLSVEGAHSSARGELAFIGAGVAVALGIPLSMEAVQELLGSGHVPEPIAIGLGISLAVGAACGWLAIRFYRRSATVHFTEPAVVVWDGERGQRLRTVLWDDVSGYRDDHADFVTLECIEGSLHVPTPTERDRVDVLALLDRRRVLRRD